jgi:transposase InsO family protein
VEKLTGLSRAQLTRLIARYTASGRVQVTVYRRRFVQLYRRADIELLASVDEAHETLSGPATRRILEREHQVYKQPEFARLATISVAHLYNLRHHQRYRERLLNYTKPQPTAVSIGERRKPQPQGQPGFLRLDTVHQGDQPEDGEKGVYHINAFNEVTQWEVASVTPRISETCPEPLLEAMMRQFPFRILGFHTDNGSQFINRMVARLLEKLRIEQTKSRPNESSDNGMVETKNGAIIRKHIGYGYIDAKHAGQINSFYREHLNPYLNYNRPCAQAA